MKHNQIQSLNQRVLERKEDYIEKMNKVCLDLGEQGRKHVYIAIPRVAAQILRMTDLSDGAQ